LTVWPDRLFNSGWKAHVCHVGAIGEFESDLINERTKEGLERVKAQGKHLGRKGQDTKEIKRALKLFAEREKYGLSVNDISKQTGVPRSTIFAKAKGAK
jgi:DNA invertase Pin-like site-specific DNA recombinase